MTDLVKDGECLDDLQLNGLKIIQKDKGFRFGIDAVLLSDYVKVEKNMKIIDLGTGTGIIPILLSAKTDAYHVTGVEIQPEMAEMARRSVMLNNLQDRITIVEGDFRKSVEMFGHGSFDAVVVNPPYTKAGSGLVNPDDAKAVSRHEIFCTLEDIINASSGLLKHHGRFFMIHRPERLVDIFYTMHGYRLEPKRIRLVHANRKSPASLVLVFGLKNGNSQLTVEAPLYVNEPDDK